MFTYENGLKKYVLERRKKVEEKNAKAIERIEVLAGKFCPDALVKELVLKLAWSAKRCLLEINEHQSSTISLISNLRFLFEICITTRLLVTEENFKYKLRYSINNHQLNKSKSLTEYAYYDINRLDKMIRDEELIKPIDVNVENIQESISKADKLYDQLDEEISIFLDMAEFNGAGFHKTHIYSFLESHQQREDKILHEWEKIKISILNDEKASQLFDFKGQLSKVEKELKDRRSWKEKASTVSLEKLYDFIYDYTSSIMHCTSYSILIPNQLEEAEINMITGLATRITSDILRNLCTFGKIPNMKIFKV